MCVDIIILDFIFKDRYFGIQETLIDIRYSQLNLHYPFVFLATLFLSILQPFYKITKNFKVFKN